MRRAVSILILESVSAAVQGRLQAGAAAADGRELFLNIQAPAHAHVVRPVHLLPMLEAVVDKVDGNGHAAAGGGGHRGNKYQVSGVVVDIAAAAASQGLGVVCPPALQSLGIQVGYLQRRPAAGVICVVRGYKPRNGIGIRVGRLQADAIVGAALVPFLGQRRYIEGGPFLPGGPGHCLKIHHGHVPGRQSGK